MSLVLLTTQSLSWLCLIMSTSHYVLFFFFFNDTATTEIYTLSLHDALPICQEPAHIGARGLVHDLLQALAPVLAAPEAGDRKSTRLNSSHLVISYAVFCLKKKKRSEQCRDIYLSNVITTEYSTRDKSMNMMM